MENDLKISKNYFEELIDYTGRSLVGKLLKRTEIIQNRKVLKKNIQELVYEHMRDFANLFKAYQEGRREIQQFRFNTKRD